MSDEPPKSSPERILNSFQETLLNGILVVFSLLLVFLALEFGARLWLLHVASPARFLQYASLRQLPKRSVTGPPLYTHHRYLGYYPTPGYLKGVNKHNSLGYRGEEIELPKPEGEFRIACLGGSTTYTTEVPDHRHSYPALLEQELRQGGQNNVTVINAGVSSWGSWETLINFEFRILDLDPDMIIIYHAINDIHPRLVWPKEAYRGDNSGGRIATHTSLKMPSILEYSTLLRIFLVRFGFIRPHAALAATLGQVPPTFYADTFAHQKIRGTYPQGIFEQVSALEMLRVNTPRYFRRNIENIATIAASRGIKTLLVTFAFSPHFKQEPRVSSEEYILAFGEMNEILKSIAQEHDLPLFDFAQVFPQDAKYFTDGRHMSILGARLKAKLFFDFIVAEDLLEPSPAPISAQGSTGK